MFSTGSGSHDGSNYPTQWALNPSAYQNVSNDQVDWAALAQQWIMMKETAPPEQIPQAPPPPTIGSTKKDVVDEGGEAPMDVENEKEENEWGEGVTANQDWSWQQNWSWGANWNGPSGVPPPNAMNSSNKSALLPTPYSHYATQNLETNSNLDYQNAPTNDYNTGYWTNNSGNRNKMASKGRMGRKGPNIPDNRLDGGTETVTLDAAKRRQLPAWIREGLEKMEREKQKQLEKEREKSEREAYLSRKKEETEGAIKLLQASGLPEKSKFDSDSEDSSSEREHRSKKSQSPDRSPPPMSEEERMQQRMLMVRRAMTEVLLQVTSTEIEIICQEELNRFRSRNSASAKKMAQYGTPSEGSHTGSLGLGMYGGETDSSSEDSDSDHQPNSLNNDSDTQLKETIRRRRAEFAKTEREIENRIIKDKEVKGSGGDKSDGAQTPDWPDSGGERDHSQVDTAQTHGSGPMKSRRHSQKSSSRTPPRKDQKSPPDLRDFRKKLSKKSSSSGSSDSDDTSDTESSSSASSHDTRHKDLRLRRERSRSTETDKSRKKSHHSRSVSNASDSDDRHSRRTDRSYSSRRSDRSRRERDIRRERSRSRSRHRRSRSRSRDGRHRLHRHSRSRSRSRSRRRRSRSHNDRYRGHRSPHGGYHSRETSSHGRHYQRNNINVSVR